MQTENAIASPTTSQEIQETKKDFVKAEVNFLQYPLGTLDKHFKGNSVSYKQTIPHGTGEIVIEWEVLANSKYGLPGPTAVRLDNAITKLIQDATERANGEVPKWIKTTFYELANKIRQKPCGVIYKTLEKDIRKLFSCTITSKSAFKKKNHPDPWGGLILHKYQAAALRGESLPQAVPLAECPDGKAKQVYIVLSDIYWQSLKEHYTKPIDYDFLMSLENPVLQRMYQLLSLAFQTRMKEYPPDKECVNYNYVEFCGRLPLKAWDQKADAKYYMKRYLAKLVAYEYLENYTFEFEGEQSKWFIRFFPGPKANEEIQFIGGQRVLFDLTEPSLKKAKLKNLEVVKNKQILLEKQKAEQDEKEYEAILGQISNLSAPEKTALKEKAIASMRERGNTIITILGTEAEMVELFKSSRITK